MIGINKRTSYISIFVMMAFLYDSNIGQTAPAYYQDNVYEKSNAYAVVSEKSNDGKDKNSNTKTKVVSDGKTKKIYNTIIIKRKKQPSAFNINNTSTITPTKAERLQQTTPTTPSSIPEITVKPVNTTLPTLTAKSKKKGIMDQLADFTAPLKQTTPDNWYLYAVAGYTISFQKSTVVSAIYSNSERLDDSFQQTTSTGLKKGNGFGFIVGAKVYLNTHKTFSVFISPEFFYDNLRLSQHQFAYTTQQPATIPDTSTFGNTMKTIQADVPGRLSTQTRDMYGFSLRLGFTLVNTLSFHAQASLGAINHKVYTNILPEQTNWSSFAVDALSDNAKNNLIDIFSADGTSNSFRKTNLLYGFGGGLELGLWNQHFLIRIDYNHYFGNGTFTVEEKFARKDTSTTANDTEIDGDKWKIKNSFGVLKLSFGLSF